MIKALWYFYFVDPYRRWKINRRIERWNELALHFNSLCKPEDRFIVLK